jgi:hypothetical protein
VRARAERAAGIDDDGDRIRRCFLPGRADPEAADPNAVMKATPGVLPAVGDVLDLDDIEAERWLLRVDGERSVELLDALREDVEQQDELRLPADDDVSLQRKALLSLSKRPSERSYVRSSACASNSRRSRRCSSLSRRGTRTLTRTFWSPRP